MLSTTDFATRLRTTRELEFTYRGYNYRCQSADLIRLGRAYRSDLIDDRAALSVGAINSKSTSISCAFSASPKQIDFWLGRGAASAERLESEWNGRKPDLYQIGVTTRDGLEFW